MSAGRRRRPFRRGEAPWTLSTTDSTMPLYQAKSWNAIDSLFKNRMAYPRSRDGDVGFEQVDFAWQLIHSLSTSPYPHPTPAPRYVSDSRADRSNATLD